MSYNEAEEDKKFLARIASATKEELEYAHRLCWMSPAKANAVKAVPVGVRELVVLSLVAEECKRLRLGEPLQFPDRREASGTAD